MEITYTLTKEDLLRYNSFLVRRTPSLRIGQIVSSLFVPLVLLFYSVGPLNPFHEHRFALLLTILITIVWIPFRMWVTRWAILKRNENTPGLFDRQTVKIGAKGLYGISGHTEITRAWPSFTEITGNTEYIYLLLNRMTVVIIPKNAFLSPQDAEAFLNAARGFWKSAVFGSDMPAVPEPTSWPPSPRQGV